MIITSEGLRDRLGRREFLGFAVGAFVVATIPLARRRPPAVVRRSVPVMGTVAHFAVVHRDEWQAHAAIDAAMAELRWVERTMTRFTRSSDVGRANGSAMHDAVGVTAETAHVVTEALRWADALDGRYDPALGAVVALWDVKNRREPPADARVSELGARGFHRAVEAGMRGGSHVLRYHDTDVRLDLGGIAKGYGVDRAVAALRHHDVGKAVVVAGGDLYAMGTAPDGGPWNVGIQSPNDDDAIVETLHLVNRAVATSGTYRQFFMHGGRRYHHIIDPITARPRDTAMQSLSIVADSVMHADAATTALFGLDAPNIARELRKNLPGAELARIV